MMQNYKQQLFEDGYTSIPHILTSAQVHDLRTTYLSIEHSASTMTATAFLQDEILSNAIFNDTVITALQAVTTDSFSIYPDFTIRKSLYIPWHTDVSYMDMSMTDSYETSDMIQVSIYLQDNTENGGGLEIIPGSHRIKNLDRKNLAKNTIDYDHAKLLPSLAGSLVLWDSRLIHRSRESNNPQEIKLAIQFTVSRTKTFTQKYLNYLFDRATAKKQHVSDMIGNREQEYLLDIPNIKYPDSFSKSQMIAINKFQLKIQVLS